MWRWLGQSEGVASVRAAKQLLTILTLAFLACGNVAADNVLSADKFAQAYLERAKTVFRNGTITMVGPLQLRLLTGSGPDHDLTINLDNPYKEYIRNPSGIGEIIRRNIRGIAGIDREGTPAAQQIVPLIRERGYLERSLSSVTQKESNAVVGEEFAGDLYIYFAFDSPDIIQYAKAKDIDAAGVDRARLLDLSLTNLRNHMPQPIVETSKDLAIIHDGGAYQSSLLLIDEFWNRFHFRGDLVVFVVSRDVLLVTGMKESEGLPAAANYARDLIKTVPYPISNVPILHRNGKWKTFPGMN